MAFTAHRRIDGNILRDFGRCIREFPRTTGKFYRVGNGGLNHWSNLLVYIHYRRRADVYIYNRRACQKYGGEQPNGIDDCRQVLFGIARHDGYARGCDTRYFNSKLTFATPCENLSVGEQHKIIYGDFQCLCRRLGERLFRVEYGCDFFVGE